MVERSAAKRHESYAYTDRGSTPHGEGREKT